MPRQTGKCYTLATVGDNTAEITMYGEVVETHPIDWWTGEPVEGEFIALDDFLRDLDYVKSCAEITLHINSVGGDGYAALAIYNRLRELPAHKTAVIDGVAMSAGSLIMCAADTVKVNPSSIIMIHKCWSYIWGAFNADEIMGVAESLDAMDRSQVEIYRAKTGKTADELLQLMGETTYMTGREAVDNGFADELTTDTELDVAASADRRSLYINGHMLHIGDKAASAILPAFKSIKTVPDAVAINNTSEGGVDMPKTLEELRNEDPELAAALLSEAEAKAVAEAVQAERQRMADIDAIASMFDDAIVNAAKYGDTACTAQEMAYRAAVQAAKQGTQYMRDTRADYEASGAKEVGSTPPPANEAVKATDDDLRAAGRNAALNLKKED